MRYLLLALSLVTLSTQALATPVTLTGAQLANLPNVQFPNGGQSISGSGLRFDITRNNGVIYRLPLNDFITDAGNISFSLAYERLLRDDGGLDQDFFIGIYDDENFFNSAAVDTSLQQVEIQNRVSGLSAAEDILVGSSVIDLGPQIAAPIGTVAQLDVSIQATPTGTTLSVSLNQSGAFITPTTTFLDPSGLSLIIVGNSLGENFIFNSLTFTNGVNIPASPTAAISEPAAFGGLALGLMTLGAQQRRRQRSQSLQPK